jgi:cyclic pyranopterin phosphate synthase
LVGFIAPMTENFCGTCNRTRVAADGSLRACLAGSERTPLRDLLDAGAPDEAIAARILGALQRKAERHGMAAGGCTLLPMVGTGG